ncbi:hypothetical protein F9U64_09015 [Gracilibacillus oryzae]|uniref:Uncharacterized protein n=1 Tax=Gracilibacillus oryzae TaxID=1672701 RepID=A0A7C8KVK2_9BACI|nr:hypothetical protein [Gracilibacillus oryzae]KAB8137527.1 hypothetical protein F9U64_09015 [Gracilibacillus oryzae]
MAKYIQAFFRTEDEAESVRVELAKVNASEVRVDHLPERSGNLFLAPLTYTGSNASSVGSGGYIPAFSINDSDDVDNSPRDYTIEFQVAEKDYGEALQIIKESDGYVDKDTLDL